MVDICDESKVVAEQSISGRRTKNGLEKCAFWYYKKWLSKERFDYKNMYYKPSEKLFYEMLHPHNKSLRQKRSIG